MRVCLCMIVKNEAHVIERCLRSVRPFIHSWAISDTGSTDGTQEIIRRVLADLPGELIERRWVDFSHNRNEALKLAAKHGDFALTIDADEVLDADDGFVYPRLEAPGYMIEVHYANTSYQRTALVRTNALWEWKGVLHEALNSPLAAAVQRLPGLRMRPFPDGARSQRPAEEKYADDAAVLQRALFAEPDNARYAFYLAQSWRDAGQNEKALSAYEHRVAMGGWDEEVFFAKFQVAVIRERLGRTYADIVAAYLEAHDFRPARAESMCELARYCRLQNRFAVAAEFARIAMEIPQPADLLFVDVTVYAWRAKDELAVSAYYCKKRELSERLCMELLEGNSLPESERQRVQKNLEFARSL